MVAALCAWATQAVLRSAPQSNGGPSLPAVTASAALSLPLLSGGTTAYRQAGIEGGPTSGNCAPTNLPTASPDASLDSVFADQQGPGWLGGDATYSTALPERAGSLRLLRHAHRDGATERCRITDRCPAQQ
ncbi:MAG TPA: hypothetical protein VMF35_01375 [Acidimicrobiales bacterium]|nr:hypothetical protein [Acidimicrobiales bacterium]